MLAVKTCNLSQMAVAFKDDKKANSNFRRLQRWISSTTFPLDKSAQWVVGLFDFSGKMTLAIPLFWSILPKC